MGSNVLVFPHYDRTLDQAAGLELFPGLRTAAACRVLRRIAEAVFHIHDRGVIHCNLGPRNGTWAEAWLIYPFLLLVTRAASLLLSNNAVVRVDDTWKLMDFGTSAHNDARRSVERIGTAVQLFCVRMVIGRGQDARNCAALLRHPETFFRAKFLETVHGHVHAYVYGPGEPTPPPPDPTHGPHGASHD